MGSPEKACRDCRWYVRKGRAAGPRGYGTCGLGGAWESTHANQRGCSSWKAREEPIKSKKGRLDDEG